MEIFLILVSVISFSKSTFKPIIATVFEGDIGCNNLHYIVKSFAFESHCFRNFKDDDNQIYYSLRLSSELNIHSFQSIVDCNEMVNSVTVEVVKMRECEYNNITGYSIRYDELTTINNDVEGFYNEFRSNLDFMENEDLLYNFHKMEEDEEPDCSTEVIMSSHYVGYLPFEQSLCGECRKNAIVECEDSGEYFGNGKYPSPYPYPDIPDDDGEGYYERNDFDTIQGIVINVILFGSLGIAAVSIILVVLCCCGVLCCVIREIKKMRSPSNSTESPLLSSSGDSSGELLTSTSGGSSGESSDKEDKRTSRLTENWERHFDMF